MTKYKLEYKLTRDDGVVFHTVISAAEFTPSLLDAAKFGIDMDAEKAGLISPTLAKYNLTP